MMSPAEEKGALVNAQLDYPALGLFLLRESVPELGQRLVCHQLLELVGTPFAELFPVGNLLGRCERLSSPTERIVGGVAEGGTRAQRDEDKLRLPGLSGILLGFKNPISPLAEGGIGTRVLLGYSVKALELWALSPVG
ncbi:hypothetical protein DM860_018075 [Cuscuta australis]|uniref:Uncharacterized protein n=1 Tax=Cuscuta australis TaxID=267555 RepID=A0A328CXP5_9ASTE|nr:hypothetical protein DM860_018075 [Cuscuta australis]